MTGMMAEALRAYEEKGYAVVDDFLPREVAEKLSDSYDAHKQWELIDQVRPDHYKHVFATKNPNLPRPGEVYKAKFDRSKVLEGSEFIRSTFKSHFIPKLNETVKRELTQFDIRCYRLTAGHLYRTHIDDYTADVGITYYFSREWALDWGGLLHIASDNDLNFIDTVYPKFNRIVLLNHGKFRFPHFVSAVNEYALKPRYTIVAFCR